MSPQNEQKNYLDILREIIVEARALDLDGNELHPTGYISLGEASFIMDLIKERKLARCVETGVAYGASTVAICGALSGLEQSGVVCKHYGIDPCQYSDYNGAAIAALRRCGIAHLFELIEGPSHLMLPRLIGKAERVDMVFVDGWHTFDYTLLDVFFADKLLRPGGMLLMHDFFMPSKRKVWGWLRHHRKYRRIPVPLRPLFRRALSGAKCCLSGKLSEACFNLTEPWLFAAEKLEEYEPSHDFFCDF